MTQLTLPPGFKSSVTKTRCPTCGKDYEVKPEMAGRTASCKGCGLSFEISHLFEAPSREYLAFVAGMEAMRSHILEQMQAQAIAQQQQAQLQDAALMQAQTRYLDASRKQGWLHAGAAAGIAAALLGVNFSE